VLAAVEDRVEQRQSRTDRLVSLEGYRAAVADNLEGFGFDERRLALAALRIRVDANGSAAVGPWRISGSLPLDDDGVVSHSAAAWRGRGAVAGGVARW
jgi:hypothetical protein